MNPGPTENIHPTDTEGQSFFDVESAFAPFRGHVRDFYKGVRCGILHQAETTMGWRIRRDGDLVEV